MLRGYESLSVPRSASHVTQAARSLGIIRVTLQRKLKKYGYARPDSWEMNVIRASPQTSRKKWTILNK